MEEEDWLRDGVNASVIDERVGMKNLWNDTDRRISEVRGEKLVPVPLRPPQIPHGLTWNSTQACNVRFATNRLSRGSPAGCTIFCTVSLGMKQPSVRLGVNYERSYICCMSDALICLYPSIISRTTSVFSYDFQLLVWLVFSFYDSAQHINKHSWFIPDFRFPRR